MKITKQLIAFVLAVIFTLMIMNYFYYGPSEYISKNQSPVLSDNWWAALNWIKNNTANCSVVATYWDPGHFITGIADRAAVFDGASQNDLLSIPSNHTDGTVIENLDDGINHIVVYKNGMRTTARIQDISTTLLTSNETLAVNILKNYMKPNCTEMYYIASADLIGKSQWWSYFATWNPIEKGKMYVYYTAQLTQKRPVPAQSAIAYVYTLTTNQAFVLYDINGTLKPYLQAGNQFLSVEKLIYFDSNGNPFTATTDNAEVKGLLWLDQSRNIIVFIPPELENSIFTRMFFFNGQGLENFEYVNQWGGELKLFKVKF